MNVTPGGKTKLRSRLLFERFDSNCRGGDFYLYAARQIGTDSPIKLGRALDPAKRIRTFLSPEPLEIVHAVPEWVVTERAAHRQWAHLRLHGEWFQATPELLAWLRSLEGMVAALAPYRRRVQAIMQHRWSCPLARLALVERRLRRARLLEAQAARIRASL